MNAFSAIRSRYGVMIALDGHALNEIME